MGGRPVTAQGGDETLKASDYTAQRNESVKEGVTALLLMNGGGAVALLAFLQATWQSDPVLAGYVVSAMVYLVMGVALAGLVHLLRFQASWNFQAGRRHSWWHRAYVGSAFLSILAFVVGMIVICRGALRVLGLGLIPPW
jgi:hypothetical protein